MWLQLRGLKAFGRSLKLCMVCNTFGFELLRLDRQPGRESEVKLYNDQEGVVSIEIREPCQDQAVCGICLDGLASFPYSWSLEKQPDGFIQRVYTFENPLPDRTAFEVYLSDPQCTPERHAWYERKRLSEAEDALEEAAQVVDDLQARKPGWSIEEAP